MRNVQTILLALSVAARAFAQETVPVEESDDDGPSEKQPPPQIVREPEPQAAQLPPAVFHTPIASAPADEPLMVRAEVRNSHKLAEVTLHYRHSGETEWRAVRFARDLDGNFLAVVPPSDTAAGTLEYFIGSRASDGPVEVADFASPGAPHAVALLGDNETRWRRELLAQESGNKSRFWLSGEFVDFGDRPTSTGNPVHDFFGIVQLDYTYRILGWIYSIRAGGGYMRGDTWRRDPSDQRYVVPLPSDEGQTGLVYGFAEVRFRAGRFVRLDGKVILGAGPNGFDGGVGGQILIGREPGTHFDLGAEYITEIGMRGWLKLAWLTVPGLPMSLTLEATTWPRQDEIAGRVYFSIGHRFGRHFTVEARGGYATRDWHLGGPSAGLATTLEF